MMGPVEQMAAIVLSCLLVTRDPEREIIEQEWNVLWEDHQDEIP